MTRGGAKIINKQKKNVIYRKVQQSVRDINLMSSVWQTVEQVSKLHQLACNSHRHLV
jgi:hypothetical protein